MGLEDFDLDINSNEGLTGSNEAIKEVSEKYKESSKKSQVQRKKTTKDEKKVQKYDILLAGILVKIIVDKKYDFILEKLFNTIHIGFSSNFVLGILSLININISNKIREISKKENISFDYKADKIIVFEENNINNQIQNRINLWIEDIIDTVSIEYSSLKTQNIIIMLELQTKEIIDYTTQIIIFFLKEINIIIKENEAKNIAIFILNEVSQVLKKLKIEQI